MNARLKIPRSAARPACEFAARPAGATGDWPRDAGQTRRRGRLRYTLAAGLTAFLCIGCVTRSPEARGPRPEARVVSVIVPHPVKAYTVFEPVFEAPEALVIPTPVPKNLWWDQTALNVRTGMHEILALPCGRNFIIERKETLDSPWAFFAVTNQPPVLIPTTGFYRIGRRP